MPLSADGGGFEELAGIAALVRLIMGVRDSAWARAKGNWWAIVWLRVDLYDHPQPFAISLQKILLRNESWGYFLLLGMITVSMT